MAYGSFVLMRDINFTVRHGDIFIIMGGSGCGKSTLLRHLIGLKEPATGRDHLRRRQLHPGGAANARTACCADSGSSIKAERCGVR